MIEGEITKPQRLVADLDSLKPDYGKFIAEPLARGFGTTLGNSLRRVRTDQLCDVDRLEWIRCNTVPVQN